MKFTTLKFWGSNVFILLAVFFVSIIFTNHAKAFSQSLSDGFIYRDYSSGHCSNNVGGTITDFGGIACEFYATSSLGSFSQINNITLGIKRDATNTTGERFSVTCSDGTGVHTQILEKPYTDFNTSFTDYIITMSPALTCDSSTLNYFKIGFYDYQALGYYSKDSYQSVSTNQYNSVGIYPNSASFHEAPEFKIAINSGFTTNDIYFQPPGFADGMTTPDFKNWYVCENMPTQNGNIKVNYGTSSPAGLTDDLAGNLGVSNLPLSTGNCVVLSKTASSTAGNYQAQAIMYNSSGSSIATSSVLNFTITNGEPINYPLQQTPLVPVAGCQPTSFAINFGFGSVDFGLGICNITTFLLMPNQNALNQWSNTKDLFAEKAPFSYFYSAIDSIKNISPTATSSPTLTLNTGTTTPIHISVDIFSPTTIGKFANSTARNVVRTIAQWALYLMFIAMVVLEGRNLLKGGK